MHKRLVLGIALLLAACCPPARVHPPARMVGLSGSAQNVSVADSVAGNLGRIAWRADGTLAAIWDDRLVWLNPATGTISEHGLPDDSWLPDRIEDVATARDGSVLVSNSLDVVRVTSDNRVEPVFIQSSWSSDSGKPKPREPGLSIVRVADDGAGGVYMAGNSAGVSEVWHDTANGELPRTVGKLPGQVKALARWQEGVIALLWSTSDPAGIVWNLQEGLEPQPARDFGLPDSLVGMPDGGIAAYASHSVYQGKLTLIRPNGTREVVLKTEEDDGTMSNGQYRVLVSCASDVYPDSFRSMGMTVHPDGRIALVMDIRKKVVVWKP